MTCALGKQFWKHVKGGVYTGKEASDISYESLPVRFSRAA